jgi:hypothetical protein
VKEKEKRIKLLIIAFFPLFIYFMDTTPIVMIYLLASGSKTYVVLTLLEGNYMRNGKYIGNGFLINEKMHEYFLILSLGPPFLMFDFAREIPF